MGTNSDKSPVTQIFSGLSMAVIFSVLWSLNRSPVWLLLGLFLGVLPVMEGLSRTASSRHENNAGDSGDDGRSEEPLKEKELLSAAKRLGGVVTPTMIVLESSLTLEETERILHDFARKGYLEMNITDSGRVEYVFPEFRKPRLES